MITGVGAFFVLAAEAAEAAEAEPFLVVNGEFIDSRLDGEGEVVVDFRRLLRRCKTTLSGEGSKTISATRGDSVSLGPFIYYVSTFLSTATFSRIF